MNVIKPFRFHSKAELETIAAKLRSQVEQSRRRRLNADSVAEGIADYLDLCIVRKSIPADRQGKIAAMIIPVKKLVYINEDISALEGGFGQSTIAHEIGHWILHIDKQAVGEYIDRQEKGLEIEVQPFLCRSQQSAKNIEWQAEYFAGCLLMPEYKLIEAKQGRDLTNWKHLYAIADEFGVTISNLLCRLKSLGWIVKNNNSKQIYLGKKIPSLEVRRERH
ncbi:ImmA/IrrE family metallo-endopeptidase [Pleurocapsa sp. FMAR1]|uniref:ImmA/IrrE family metallo-endopeptidase n=1 Tax=Pleurocapsa sp. FMAR1 TaxID=3040204 RepID=UPI0029C88086|nr:ImmA/IrrE family metallo-endopeptidase [Pleurocapsa sp. FMAR1]